MSDQNRAAAAWPAIEADTAKQIATHDWATTPIGPPASWPAALKVAVDLILVLEQPAMIAWGPELIQLPNDAFVRLFDPDRDNPVIGRSVATAWPEAWDIVRPGYEHVLAGQGQERHEHQLIPMTRHGRVQDFHWTYTYAPISDVAAAHGVGGVLLLVSETAALMSEVEAADGQQLFLSKLNDALRPLSDPAAVRTEACRLLREELDADWVVYGLIDVTRDIVDIDLGDTRHGAVPVTGEQPLSAYGWAMPSYSAGRTVVVADAQSSDQVPQGERAAMAMIQMTALISVPLLKGGALVGALAVSQGEPRDWTRAEIRLVEETAERIWEAIERARAEAAHRQSEEQMRALLTASSEVLYRMSPDWTVMRELAGGGFLADTTSPNQAWLSNYIHPEDQDFVGQAIAHAIATKGVFDLEHRVLQEDGSVGWTVSRAVPILDGNGEIREWFGAASDVTSRKRAEESLRASEERLRLIVENVRDYAIFVTDRAGLITDWLPGAVNVFGWSVEEAVGQPAQMTFTPEDREKGAPEWEWSVAEQKGIAPNIRWHVRKDGARVFIEGSTTALRDRDGRLHGFLKIGQNVTARKQADEAVRQSEERLRRVLDQLFALVGVTTPDGTFVEVNRAPLEGAGITAADVIGKPLWDAYWWSYAPGVQEQLREAVARASNGEVLRYDIAARMDAEAPVTIDFQIAPLRDDAGVITHLVPSAIVVEDRVRAQAELQQLNETLEQRVADAVDELTRAEEALRQSQKLESMGQLTGGVAHDFNNLLTPIIGSLDMLQRRQLGDERTQRLIGGALQSAERAKTLVQRLLAFARRQPLQPIPVALSALLTDMADLVSSTSGPRVEVELDVSPDLPAIKADPNQLEMAILNLSVNARDAMPDGGRLTIEASPAMVDAAHRSGLKPGEYVRLCVADTGVGMDEATLLRAVEPFFSTKGIGRGTGLGLSMVHGLAGQLGGALTIQSEVDVGTVVELWLPISAEAALSAEPGQPVRRPSITGLVLLIDDEDVVRASTADMLGELGYDVIEANSAKEGLSIIGSGSRPDIVVTDHLMPGMTGTELAHRLRTMERAIPTLIISGYAEDEGIAPDLPRLTKPFRQSELAASLAQLRDKE
jgi:PAS domain S-box-containing protein